MSCPPIRRWSTSRCCAEPDPKWGEVGRAFVQLAPTAAGPTAPSSPPSAAQRLAPYKVPRRFEFVADFPRTSAGKIQKHLLAARPDKRSAARAF